MRHLFVQVPDKKQQHRFDLVLAAHDAHKAQIQALRDELGLNAAEARADELSLRWADIEKQIGQTPARSPEGLWAKARYLQDFCPSELNEDGSNCDRIIMSIIRDLSRHSCAPAAVARGLTQTQQVQS